MPKVSVSNLRSLARIYAQDHIVTDDHILRCNLCDLVINVDVDHQKDRVQTHINSVGHKKKSAAKQSGCQQFIGAAFAASCVVDSQNAEFRADLCAAFISAGIPLFKLQNPLFRSFIQKYTGKTVPDESSIRKTYVTPVYDATIKKIKDTIGDSCVYFVLDETTDVKGRYVLNVLIGALNGTMVKPMLFKVYA